MKKFYRGFIYCIGLLLLALGIILNTKTGLGVSPIVAIPYCISNIFSLNLGDVVLCFYILCVIGQIFIRGKKFRVFDLLQIPMSVVFTRLINIFNKMIQINCQSWINRIVFLIIAIALTGIGAALSIQMRIVPNAADGFTQALGEKIKKTLGFAKNITDITCVLVTVVIGMIFCGKIVGIGVGTVAAVIGVGRFIALFNVFFKEKMLSVVS